MIQVFFSIYFGTDSQYLEKSIAIAMARIEKAAGIKTWNNTAKQGKKPDKGISCKRI